MTLSSQIECSALADLHAAAPPVVRDKLGLTWSDVDGVAVSIAPGLPDSAIVLNRVPDISTAVPLTPKRICAVRALYADAGVERYFVQSVQAFDASLLPATGLKPGRAWQTFRHNGQVPDMETEFTIREIGPEHSAAFGAIVSDGFDLGAGAVDWLACLPGRANWHVFMAFDGAEPVGAGTLFASDGLGWCDWAATVPKARGKGCQSALIAARLIRAYELGCRDVFSCTGAAVPDDPQHSYHNLLRAGFRETDLRETFVPDPRRATF